ncbi:MAG: hypothetical protein FWG96_06690 [Methanomassiliicoccaceae archaeon]|nr:hypothetical protein [Methanomassiliicoccaceae archaeon]
MKDAGLEASVFESTGFFKVTFKRPLMHTLTIEEVPDRMPIKLTHGLTENEIRVCELISIDVRITIIKMSKELKLTTRQTHIIISLLTEKGTVRRIGSKKTGSWVFFGAMK